MKYDAKKILRIGDLRTLVRQAEQDAGGNREKADELISASLDELFDEGVCSPKDLTPYIVARAAVGEFDDEFAAHDGAKKLSLALSPSGFDNILHKTLSRITMDEFNYLGADLLNICSEDNATSSDYDEIPAMTPIPELRQRLPNAEFEETSYGAYSLKCPIYDKGLIIRINQELLWDSKKFAEVVSNAEKLGQSTAMTIGKAVTQTVEMGSTRPVFEQTEHAQNLAFVLEGTNHQAQFYSTTTHATIDGQTNPNQVAGAGSGITWNGFEAAFQLLQDMKDMEGKAIAIPMRYGLFPSKYEHRVRQMLETPQVAGTANNDKNTFAGTLKPYFTPFFSSDDYYYLGDFPNGLNWRWREKPGMETIRGGESEITRRIVATYRWALYFGLCWTDYRYVVKAL